MKLVFLLEERSMKELLDGILPRILPQNVSFQTIPHNGKSDLRKSIPIKLKGWNEPNVAFVIVHDQDSNDCMTLKQDLIELCAPYGKRILVRIPCHELEAWYWGDLAAVSAAYGCNLTTLNSRAKYRYPDKIENPKQELKKHLPSITQIDGARRIAPHMNIQDNTSHSFKVFVQGVQAMCKEDLSFSTTTQSTSSRQ